MQCVLFGFHLNVGLKIALSVKEEMETTTEHLLFKCIYII